MTIKAIKSNQSICYSFSSRWFKSLTSGKVKVFFRKVRPIRVPELTFFYVGSPIKQIIGYAYIKKIEKISLNKAKSFKSDGMISEEELESYFGTKKHIHSIWIENQFFFEKPFNIEKLQSAFDIFAPQSFFNVSTELETFLMGEDE